MEQLIRKFFPDITDYKIVRLDSGHINTTYRLTISRKSSLEEWILQSINTFVFKNPYLLSHNLRKVSDTLISQQYKKGILFPIPSIDNQDIEQYNEQYWRILPYFDNTITYLKAKSEDQVYFAAQAIGNFTKQISKIEPASIKNPIPAFHNFKHRMEKFDEALKFGDIHRITEAEAEIKFFVQESMLIESLLYLQKEEQPRNQPIHGDPKISNLLFANHSNEVKAIIDWDTVMVSSPWLDFGDMVRSYCCTDDENAKYVYFSLPFYKALLEGLLDDLPQESFKNYKNYLPIAAQGIIYIQGIRFLTDYLTNDTYYKIEHEKHNLQRARNQISLVKDFIKQKKDL